MNRRKYILAVYGKNARTLKEMYGKNLLEEHLVMQEEELLVYENQVYDTGLPIKPVVLNNICLHFHGIVFPQKNSLDHFSENRDHVIRNIIKENSMDLKHIPYSIQNGSYVAIAIDNKEKRFLAFTCFLNSIPFYYIQIDSCIVVSTDLELLAKAFKLEYSVNDGVLEYYASGTNLSDKTAFPEINCIPKGAYLEFCNDSLYIDYYYKMPIEESQLSFDDHVDKFAELWKETVTSIHSDKYKFGLGFTGGIDSRLILAALSDRKTPLLFTGAHPKNPDVLIAKHITERLGLSNHIMEDYSRYDRVKGYAKHNAMSGNPFLCHSFYTHEQMQFREEQGLTYELIGLTEFLGGEYHYTDRRSIQNVINMSSPLFLSNLSSRKLSKMDLINLGLRNQYFGSDFTGLSDNISVKLENILIEFYEFSNLQIQSNGSMLRYLERFRHIYKMSNLLIWDSLDGRRYKEVFSPSLSMELTTFAAQIPLKHREVRKILLAYLKRYHPELSNFILSGTVFTPNAPWLLYKTISPYINVLNHLGVKIWPFQWYIKKYDDDSKNNNQERFEMQRTVCEESYIIKHSELGQLYDKHKYDTLRLMRLYNIALFEKKMTMDEDQLYEYLCSIIEQNRA